MNDNTPPALSVVMSMGDSGQPIAPSQLDLAIRAIRAQSFADFEFLILVDGIDEAAGKIIMGHALDDRRIRIITGQDDADHGTKAYQGSAGLNLLHEVARAPFIARANASDISAPDRLERQMALAAENPDHGVIGTGCVHRAPSPKQLVRRDPAQPLSAHAGFVWPEPANPDHAEPLEDRRLRASFEAGPPMDAATLLYSRALVLAVDGYRPALGHAAGYDLLLRLSSHTRMAKLPQALVTRVKQAGDLSAPRDESQIVARASQNAIAWLCHRERLAGRLDPISLLGRLPSEAEFDRLFGRGAGDVVRRRVVEASLHAPQALAGEGWDMLRNYASRHTNDPRMWRLAAKMLVSGNPVRAGQLGMTLITA